MAASKKSKTTAPMAAFKAVEPLEKAVEKAPDGQTLIVTERGVGAVAAAAQVGYSRAGIAALLGISRKSLALCIERQPELEAAVGRAEAALEAELVGLLVQGARKGQYAPAMFLLKTRFGYRETGPTDGSAQPSININIPPPLSADEFRKFVEERGGATIEAKTQEIER